MRVAEGSTRSQALDHGQAFYHDLTNASEPTPRRVTSYAPKAAAAPTVNIDAMLERWRPLTPAEGLAEYADELGVNGDALRRLDVMYAPEHRAWAWPMSDERAGRIGVRLRNDEAQKWTVTGSRSGIFLPSGLSSAATPLFIVEGPTDTAAAISIGLEAIGRPSCSGGAAIIAEILRQARRRDVIVIADQDKVDPRTGRRPGMFGAEMLANNIAHLTRTIKVITTAPHKDLRKWKRAGCNADTIFARVNAARYHRKSEE